MQSCAKRTVAHFFSCSLTRRSWITQALLRNVDSMILQNAKVWVLSTLLSCYIKEMYMQSTDQLIRSGSRDRYREMNIAWFPVLQADSINRPWVHRWSVNSRRGRQNKRVLWAKGAWLTWRTGIQALRISVA